MASLFEIIDEEYIEELKHKSENENTKNSTKWWKNVARLGQIQQLLKTRVILIFNYAITYTNCPITTDYNRASIIRTSGSGAGNFKSLARSLTELCTTQSYYHYI